MISVFLDRYTDFILRHRWLVRKIQYCLPVLPERGTGRQQIAPSPKHEPALGKSKRT